MLTISVDPCEAVVKRTLSDGQKWFNRIGVVLDEKPEDPIAFVVPSVIVPEYNVILYPRPVNFEPEFVRIESLEPFEFDPRLFEQIHTA